MEFSNTTQRNGTLKNKGIVMNDYLILQRLNRQKEALALNEIEEAYNESLLTMCEDGEADMYPHS